MSSHLARGRFHSVRSNVDKRAIKHHGGQTKIIPIKENTAPDDSDGGQISALSPP